MNCIYHDLNPITTICTAPHNQKCQRKLCAQCLFEHDIKIKYAIPINTFQEQIIKKLQQFKLHQSSEQNKLGDQRVRFKSLLSQTEIMLKKIWEELSESIQQLFNTIEMLNNQYINSIDQNTNIVELSYTDLDKLVQIFEGKQLQQLSDQKNLSLMKLEYLKNWCRKVQGFYENMGNEIKVILQLNTKTIEQEDQDLYELLSTSKKFDMQVFSVIIEMLRREKTTDCIGYLSSQGKLKQLEKIGINNIQLFTKILKEISESDFNKKNYSTQDNEQITKDLIKQISQDKQIIEFFKFLVLLTAIDERFIQCGSNSINLLVKMKVDLREQSYENIRIRNTSLVGGNFVRCNLNGSIFDDVDISGINLNQAQLFNCIWKKIKIHGLNKLDGHTSNVLSVCFSPDSTTLASGSDDNSICLWDAKTGQQKKKIDGHTSWVKSICFSPDGITLASGSNDTSIRLWDVKTGYQKLEIEGHDEAILSLCISPNGSLLASGSQDNSIRLWDVKTGQQKAKLDGHIGWVQSVCFSPDNITLASGSFDNTIRLWDVKTGQQKAKLDYHRDWVYSVCFSPDGTTLASSSRDNSIRFWESKSGLYKFKIKAHDNTVNTVCFSPDGTTLASGSDDKSINLWDVQTGQRKATLDGHSDSVMSVCFSPDGTNLASGSNDKSIRLWDVTTGEKAKIDCSVFFSADGNTLASSRDNSIRLWNVQTGQQIISLDNSYPMFQKKDVLPKNSTSNITILQISSNPNFESKGALILKGEFVTNQCVNLKQLFEFKGGIILEMYKQRQILNQNRKTEEKSYKYHFQ